MVSLEEIPETMGVTATVHGDNAEQAAKQEKVGLLGLFGICVCNVCLKSRCPGCTCSI